MESTPAIEHLRIYRLRHDLTFGQLADQMSAAGFRIGMRNLHRILCSDLLVGPRDTTMFKVDQFVAYLQAQEQAQERLQQRRRPKKVARRA